MTILVPLLDNRRHLICTPYSIMNLHILAKSLGIEKLWYHPGRNPHYDIPKYRFKELKDRYGTISPKEILKVIRDYHDLHELTLKG